MKMRTEVPCGSGNNGIASTAGSQLVIQSVGFNSRHVGQVKQNNFRYRTGGLLRPAQGRSILQPELKPAEVFYSSEYLILWQVTEWLSVNTQMMGAVLCGSACTVSVQLAPISIASVVCVVSLFNYLVDSSFASVISIYDKMRPKPQ